MSTNPTSGGSWIRDPVTGELRPNVPPATPDIAPEPQAEAPSAGGDDSSDAATPSDPAPDAPAARRKKG